ncbi:conjugal transfer protein TraF [Candidatus Fermentibacteria bacterium]|nr:conjugal transfer protein TraF [Candidatus Fermentibacteria bacterium]
MKTMLFAASLVLAAAPPALAAFEELELGVADQAMGSTGVMGTGAVSVLSNPASPAGSAGWSVTASSRLPFSITDLATHGLDVSMPLRGTWRGSASIRQFGFSEYSEQMVAVTISGMLGRELAFGIQPTLGAVSIGDGVSSYGSATALSLNAGFQARICGRWRIGASVRNPFESGIGESGEHLERRIDAGVAYEPSAGMESRFSLSRDFRGTRVHAGQAVPVGPLSLMAGVGTSPVTISGGLSACVSGVRLEYAVQSHPDLQPTHQAGITYVF